jgi:hypothetical protein
MNKKQPRRTKMESKRQQVNKMFGKVVLSTVEKRAAAVAALAASDQSIKTIEDAKVILAAININNSDSVAARWYRECSRNESQLKALLREYRKNIKEV